MKESEIISKAKEGYKKEFQELPNNQEFLDFLTEKNNEKKKSLFPLWISKPVPAYSLAILFFLFSIPLLWFNQKPAELIVYRDGETVIQRDTIVVRDTISIQHTIESRKPKTLIVKNATKSKRKNKKVKPNNSSGEFYFNTSQFEEQLRQTGTSADDELAQFLGVNI